MDTPGHVDFSYEVSRCVSLGDLGPYFGWVGRSVECMTLQNPTHDRSLSACQGALLLVDSTQGIQAQTLSTYSRATEQGLSIIPVVTKADLPHAQTDEVTLQMAATLEVGATLESN